MSHGEIVERFLQCSFSMMKTHTLLRTAPAILLVSIGVSYGASVTWTDWDHSDLSTTVGAIGSVGVTFTGNLQFAQVGDGLMFGAGASSTTDYWTEGSPAPYTGNAVVDNAPTAYELLAFSAASSSNQISFDAPVLNPVMAIVSMGQSGAAVTYDFDSSFTVLSEGRGYWGDGSYTVSAGDILNGNELHAVIQFSGSVSTINWSSTSENWHGFTVGVPSSNRVPDTGATAVLLALALGGISQATRRMR